MFLDQRPGTHLLRHHLAYPAEIIADPLDAEQARQPPLCPIGRWGHLPYAQSMTPRSVSALARACLSSRAPMRRALPVPFPGGTHTLVDSNVVLDSSYYERGAAARHREHESLADLAAIFGEIEARVDELLTVLEGLR